MFLFSEYPESLVQKDILYLVGPGVINKVVCFFPESFDHPSVDKIPVCQMVGIDKMEVAGKGGL